jgi:hypothetical protein
MSCFLHSMVGVGPWESETIKKLCVLSELCEKFKCRSYKIHRQEIDS